MEAGEYDCCATVFFYLVHDVVVDSSLFEVFCLEQMVAYQEGVDGLHFYAAEDLLLTVCDEALVLFHGIVEFLEKLVLVYGLSVDHFALDLRIG